MNNVLRIFALLYSNYMKGCNQGKLASINADYDREIKSWVWDHFLLLSVKHSHMKRNSLDTQAVFIEFLDYVKNSKMVAYWVARSFSQCNRAGDDIEGILVFLDSNAVTAIAKAKRLRDRVRSCSFWNTILENYSESFFK